MNGYPGDMFEEMDTIFDHLFSRMHENFMDGSPQVTGFRIVIDSTMTPGATQESPAVQPRAGLNPAAEVHRLDDEVKVIAELPGAARESIRLDVQGSTLVIDADGPDTPYHTTAGLPSVDTGSMKSTFRNGVLEVTFRLLPEEPVSA
jgi:HSP20 family molecular chaperone IbpA